VTKRPPTPTAALPTRFTPQLATLVTSVSDSDDWLHEIKFDGYRIGARLENGVVKLLSRAGNDWTASFPEVRDAVAALPVRQALLDGEVAAVLPDGRTSFQALQKWLSGSGTSDLVYFVFDLLHLDGEDVARLPLEERKTRLEALLRPLPKDSLLRYSAHVVGGGKRFLAAACERGLEGIVSKRRDRAYDPGKRGGWTKSKCLQRQAMVIGGFTEPSDGTKNGLGALLLGVYDEQGALRFAGKVGTGFSQRGAGEIRARLDDLARAKTPFADPPPEARRWGAQWVEPTLVADVRFSEWTDDHRLRQSAFLGLRTDVPAREVVRAATPADSDEIPTPKAPRRTRGAVRAAPKVTVAPKGSVELGGVRLTHPERILYPAAKITKVDLAHFYEEIGEWLLPHIAGRPLSLVRCPTGIGSCFYVKHATTADPGVLRRIDIEEKDETREYSVVDGMPGVMALVQMSILEIHPWNSVADDLERPDRVIIDLDPGPEVKWPAVLEAAELVRIAFETLGLKSFVKTTGGKGLHVVAPFVPERDWDTCLDFARGVSEFIVRQHPTRYTTAMPKRGREKKILLDYYRNHRGSTAIAAFSTRAREGAPVAVPLAWDELSPKLASDQFTVANVRQRLKRLKRDPWHEYWTIRQRISAKALAAVTT
jgi:bifunctional non-homologous end joining protein LigD